MHKTLYVLTQFASFCSLTQKQVKSRHLDARYFIAEICN